MAADTAIDGVGPTANTNDRMRRTAEPLVPVSARVVRVRRRKDRSLLRVRRCAVSGHSNVASGGPSRKDNDRGSGNSSCQ